MRLAAAGLTAHLVYQVSARVLSFLIRTIVIRALKPSQFAYVEIRLYLIVALALLPTIQGFRPVALRIPSEAAAAALSYVCTCLTLVLALVLGGGMQLIDPVNKLPLIIVTLSLFARAFAEIPLVFARRRERYAEGSRARAISTVASGIMQTIAVGLVTDAALAPAASSTGHLAYSVCLGLTMYHAAGLDGPLPSIKAAYAELKREHLVMAAVSTGEGAIKFFLENGESFFLDLYCTSTVKAGYKLAGNLASVLARLFSEGLEEQSFNVFHRLAPAFRKEGGDHESQIRNTCVKTLVLALKASISVSVLFALIGPAYSYSLLRLLYGDKWADDTPAPRLLNLYFVYLVFMAANGVSEAFVSASASTEELKIRTKFATSLSCMYMTSLYFAAKYFQAEGILYVNCINMTMRTCYSAWFFQRLTHRSIFELRHAIPNFGVLVGLIGARTISRMSETYFLGPVGHRVIFGDSMEMLVGIALHGMSGVLAVAIFGGSLALFEKQFVSDVRKLRSHQD